jgi:hypothetical protein
VRHVLLPPIPVIEHLCATALTRAERATFDRLTKPLTEAHCAALDSVLTVRKGEATSTLAWLRQPPGVVSANAVLAHLARLRAVRELALPARRTPESVAATRARGSADRGLSDTGI